MIKRTSPVRDMENVRGGKGPVHADDFATLEETFGHLRLFSRFLLPPGSSIGYHTHDTDMEYYYILSGTATVNDNGEITTMGPGEVMVTRDGAGHDITNCTDEPLEFMAVVVNA